MYTIRIFLTYRNGGRDPGATGGSASRRVLNPKFGLLKNTGEGDYTQELSAAKKTITE
jgi:hypothetical protein